MHSLFVGKVFSRSQSTARRNNALNRRRVCQRLKHNNFRKNARFLKSVYEKACYVVFNAHAGKDHYKVFVRIAYLRLSDNLRGELVMRQTVARKNRQLLTADKRVHSVYCADTCLDKVARIDTRIRVYRVAVYVNLFRRNNFRIAVDWLA